MGHSKRRLVAAVISSSVAVSLLVFLILSSHVAMALMPVVGIGGVYGQIDSFEGNDGYVYPEYTDGSSFPVATDTPACEQIPMLVVELEDGEVNNFDIRKDIELPHLSDRWMSIRIEQGFGGSIELDSLQIYTTQLAADSLLVRNIQLEEQGHGGKFGPNSGEFTLEGGQDTSSFTPGLEADGVEIWLHAVTGQGITFQDDTGVLGLDIDIEYPTTSELESYYDGRLGYDTWGVVQNREDYMGCTPDEQYGI